MADPTLEYEKNLPGLLTNLDSALKTQSSGNSSALDQYMGYLNQRQAGAGEVNLPLMAFAAGLGKPTRTGSFGESLSSGLESTMPYIQSGREGRDNRSAELLKIGMAKNGLATELAAKRLEMSKYPLTAQGDISQSMQNTADINFMRSRQAVPALGGKPGSGVPGAIQGGGAGVPATPAPASQVPLPATPPVGTVADSPPMTLPAGGMPMTLPPEAASAQGPGAPPAMAGSRPPMQMPPQAAAAGDPNVLVGGDGTDGLVVPPPVDLTAMSGAQGVTPLPESYVPGTGPNNTVQLGGGIVGVRPPRAIANQLNAATRIAQLGAQNPGSKLAQAQATVAENYLKGYREKGYEWDPLSQTIVPMGAQDPATAGRLKYGEAAGTKRGTADNTLTTIPQPGTNGLGPGVATTEGAVLGDLARTQGAGPGTIMKPDARTEGLAKELPKYEAQVREAAEIIPQNKVALDHIKDVFSKYEPGTWAEHKAEIAGALRSLGVDTSKLPADMNAAAYQQVVKGAVDQVFKRVQEIGGRVLASEIIGLSKAVFDPSLQPEANRELVASIAAGNEYAGKYVNDYNAWRKANPYDPDVTAFRIEWAKRPENDFQAIKNRQVTETMVKGAKPIDAGSFAPPPVADRKVGQKFNSPKGIVEWRPEGWIVVK